MRFKFLDKHSQCCVRFQKYQQIPTIHSIFMISEVHLRIEQDRKN